VKLIIKIKIKKHDQRTKTCAQDRQKYINMPSEKNKARIEQVTSTPELKCILPCEESFVMVNPAYIATDQEIFTSTLNVSRRKPLLAEEKQALLHRRNEEFSTQALLHH
jgi:hypothetical protein